MTSSPSISHWIETWLTLADSAIGPFPVMTLRDPFGSLKTPEGIVGTVLATVLFWLASRRWPPGGGAGESDPSVQLANRGNAVPLPSREPRIISLTSQLESTLQGSDRR